MKIGYACINQSLDCRSSRTFRLKNYSEEKLKATIDSNLDCLLKILKFNLKNKILFFRITSDLIPFGSHPIMKFDWQDHFKLRFREIGKFITKNNMRITMHPGQYTVLNSKNRDVYEKSLSDLEYHVAVLDLLGLSPSAKVQIHVGGVYQDKKNSMKRFIERYENLEENIKNRLIIENDDRSYSFTDILQIHKKIKISVVFDIYHHECLNNGMSIDNLFESFISTWKRKDGHPIVHYSSEHLTKGKCKHAETIDIKKFYQFILKTKSYNFDIMLEIKDKEKSALKAINLLKDDPRFNKSRL